MLNSSDPEMGEGSDTEVKIIDLDEFPRVQQAHYRHRKWSWMLLHQRRLLMGVAVIVGIAILVAQFRVPSAPKTTKGTTSNMQINYPVSLSTRDGISYVGSTDGTVTALRVSDGFQLWQYKGGPAGEESVTVADGIVYLVPFTFDNSTAMVSSVTLYALHANNGTLLWSRTFTTNSPATLQLIVNAGIVYLRSAFTRIDALDAHNGTSLWHYNAQTSFIAMPAVTQGVMYIGTGDAAITALRATDGTLLWRHFAPTGAAPVVVDGIVYLNLQAGGIEALNAGDGTLRWRYTLPILIAYLSSPPVVEGVLYASTQDGTIVALRANDGMQLWRVALRAPDPVSALVLQDGTLYVNVRMDGVVYAVNSNDGTLLWQYRGQPEETLNTVMQGVVYLTQFSNGINTIARVTALRASDSSVQWDYTPSVFATQLAPTDGLMLVALQDGHVNAIRISSGSLGWQRVVNS